MNAIILCGGLSTRLGDIAKDTPKILLPIGDRTVFDWQLEKIKALGITDVVLAAGHLSHVLEAALGDEQSGVHLTHAVEPERLGTGGAIKFAWQFVKNKDEPTLILNGDVLTTLSVKDMAAKLRHDSEGIILGSLVSDASTYGTLAFDETGRLFSFKEKEGIATSGHINGGFYLLTPEAKKYFPEKNVFSIEYDVFPRMKNLFVYPSEHPWVDVGLPDRLQWARDHWKIFRG
jgi:NDP-sugar pyrophosphorylase family protein